VSPSPWWTSCWTSELGPQITAAYLDVVRLAWLACMCRDIQTIGFPCTASMIVLTFNSLVFAQDCCGLWFDRGEPKRACASHASSSNTSAVHRHPAWRCRRAVVDVSRWRLWLELKSTARFGETEGHLGATWNERAGSKIVSPTTCQPPMTWTAIPTPRTVHPGRDTCQNRQERRYQAL
jgi:hypothetical protein